MRLVRASDLTLRMAASCVAALPSPMRARFGALLGYVAGSVLRIRRRLVEDAMREAGVASPSRTAAAMYRALGTSLVDLLFVAGANHDARARTVASAVIDPRTVAELDAALARGPVVLFASHTGNWELAAAAAARLLEARGRRLAVIAKAMSARGVDGFLARLRHALGIDVVAPAGAFAAARRALRAGNVVVMPIDQVPDRTEHALSASFLERMAFVDRAPATVAWRAGATVLVVAAEPTASGYRVTHLDTIAPAHGTSARAWIDATTLRATAALDRFVREHPAAWLWLHRRWKAPRVTSLSRRPRRGSSLASA